MPVVTKEFLSSIQEMEPAVVTRTADYSVWWQTITPDDTGVVRLFEGGATHGLAIPASDLESVIISGVSHGWPSLQSENGVPQSVIDLDKFLHSTGYGIVTRIVGIWYFCLLNDVRSRARCEGIS